MNNKPISIIKICKRHKELTLNDVRVNSRGSYICKACARISHAKWKKNNPDTAKLVRKKTWDKNKHKYKQSSRESYRQWRENNIEKIRKYKNELFRRYRKELHDIYIKDLICKRSNLSPSEITEKMIEIKRASIILKRFIKEGKRID